MSFVVSSANLRAQKVRRQCQSQSGTSPERTACARRVGARVHACPGQGPRPCLKLPDSSATPHPARLAVEPAQNPMTSWVPWLPGPGAARLQPLRRRSSRAAPVQVAGREPRDQFDQCGTMLRRKAPPRARARAASSFRRHSADGRSRGSRRRRRRADRRSDCRPRPTARPLAAIHAQLAEERDALRSGREVLRLEIEECACDCS